MARIPIAVQLYSVKDACAADLPGTLEAVARIGYEGVEFAGYHGRSAEELKTILGDTGLKVVGSHMMLEPLLGDELQRTVEFNLTLGNRYLICAWVPSDQRDTPEKLVALADTLSDIAERLQPHGMRVGYHNHHEEFQSVDDGRTPWDILFGAASEEVIMQVDAGNAMSGGGDVIPALDRFPGRALTVHVKEWSRSQGWAIPGRGDVRWDEFFRLCETVGGTEWYIVEQRTEEHAPLECIELCLGALRAMGR
jgi:sugar phosphate isomerase/epimerase